MLKATATLSSREAEAFLFSCTTGPQLTQAAFSACISVPPHLLLILKIIEDKSRLMHAKITKYNKSCTENFCTRISVSTQTESPAQTSYQSSACLVSSIRGRLPDGCWFVGVYMWVFVWVRVASVKPCNAPLTLSTSFLVFPPLILI